jgi:hypothetical protein
LKPTAKVRRRCRGEEAELLQIAFEMCDSRKKSHPVTLKNAQSG